MLVGEIGIVLHRTNSLWRGVEIQVARSHSISTREFRVMREHGQRY